MNERRWTKNSYIPEQIEKDLSRSRTNQKGERVAHEKALVDLVVALESYKPKVLLELGVPDEVIEVLALSQKIQSPIARGRHLRRLRKLLRDEQWQEIKRNLELRRAGFDQARDGAFASDLAKEWTDKLLTEMDAALSRFLKEYPDTDRPGLRRLMRTYAAAKAEKKAAQRLQVETFVERIVG